MDDKVYIIILNWNGTDDTIDCLKSLKSVHYNNYEIVLVDNGSSKENLLNLKKWCQNNFKNIIYYTKDQIEKEFKFNSKMLFLNSPSCNNLIFIESNENLGFAAGNNLALKYVLKNNGIYSLLLNNDTVVTPEFLTILMNIYKKNPELGAVIPQIRFYYDKEKIWNCGGKIFFGFRKYYFANKSYKKLPSKSKIKISFATGCAILFKPNEVGLLSENFFFGEEDFEFAYRMLKLNKKMACVLDSIIYHKVSKSIKKESVKGRIFIYYLNRFINMKTQFNNLYLWITWKYIYIIYIYILLLLSNFKTKEAFLFIRLLNIESIRKNKVDYNDFQTYLKKIDKLCY